MPPAIRSRRWRLDAWPAASSCYGLCEIASSHSLAGLEIAAQDAASCAASQNIENIGATAFYGSLDGPLCLSDRAFGGRQCGTIGCYARLSTATAKREIALGKAFMRARAGWAAMTRLQ